MCQTKANNLKRSKIVFVIFAVIFFIILMLITIDFSRRTKFRGSGDATTKYEWERPITIPLKRPFRVD